MIVKEMYLFASICIHPKDCSCLKLTLWIHKSSHFIEIISQFISLLFVKIYLKFINRLNQKRNTSLYDFIVKLTLLPFSTHNKNVRLFYRKDIKALCIVLPATTLWSVSHRCKLFGFMHYMFYSLKIFLNVFSKFGCLAGQISY